MMKPVREVKIGMMLDLEGDKYADKGTDPSLEFEYARVKEIEHETPECTVIHTQLGSYGFPPDHKVKIGN